MCLNNDLRIRLAESEITLKQEIVELTNWQEFFKKKKKDLKGSKKVEEKK